MSCLKLSIVLSSEIEDVTDPTWPSSADPNDSTRPSRRIAACQIDPGNIGVTSRKLRHAALPSFWSHATLTPEGDSDGGLDTLESNPDLWLLVRYLQLDATLLESPWHATDFFVAHAFKIAKNLRGVHTYGGPLQMLPTIVSNALRASKIIKEMYFSSINGFQDVNFGFSDIEHLEVLSLKYPCPLIERLIRGQAPSRLVTLSLDEVKSSPTRGVIFWALENVRRLRLNGSGKTPPVTGWGQKLLERANHLTSTTGLPPIKLESLYFIGIGGFFSHDMPATSPPSIFRFLSKISLISLALFNYGKFHWQNASIAFQFSTLTNLTLGVPEGHARRSLDRTQSAVDDVSGSAKRSCVILLIELHVTQRENRESLLRFLSSLPQLEYLELQDWTPSYDLAKFFQSTSFQLRISTPCLDALLLLVGVTSVQTLRLRNNMHTPDYNFIVAVCTWSDGDWSRELSYGKEIEGL
ncbi:hypothetical protein P7C70_g1587, partial [Phenoliferia sp. Uapishka_3]